MATNSLGKEIKYNNKEELLNLIKNDVISLQFANDDLLNDKEFVLECIKINGWVSNYVSNNLKDDKDIVINSLFPIPRINNRFHIIEDEYGNSFTFFK